METAFDVLRYLTLGAYVLLGVLGLVHQRTQGSRAGAWLAATFGTLAIVLIAGLLMPMDSESDVVVLLEKVQVAVLVLFPYFLYRFMLTFVERKRWFWILAHVLTAAAAGGVFLFRELPEDGETASAAFEAYVIVILVQWSILSVRFAIRMWRAGRKQTSLVRFRVRMMALGALMLAVALIIAGQSGSDDETTWTDVTVQGTAAVSALLFLAGFWPPGWLRRSLIYARRDPFELTRELATFAPDRQTIAERALVQTLELVSAQQGFVADPSGQILARRGVDDALAARLARETPEGHEPVVFPVGDELGRDALVVPMPIEEGMGCLVVLSTSYTRFFGRDDIVRLSNYVAVTAEALERVRITEQLQFLLDAISDLGEGFVITEEGKLITANEAYVELTGYSLDELRSLPSLVQLAPEEDRAELAERMRLRLAGTEVKGHYETRLLRKDGKTRDIEVAVKLARWGQRNRLISLVRDITTRKRAEENRDRFISDAAHELRTPISTLLGFAELLDNDLPPDKRQEVLSGIGRAGVRIRNLIKNLLDLSRLQRGVDLHLRSTPVADLIDSALELSPPPEDVAVDLQLEDDLTVLSDPSRMDEVFSNLLVNAYRYGGSRIVVRTGSRDGKVSIEIEDDGPGVEESLLTSLFEPFARGTASSKVGGSGLGLAIVRGLVEATGGTIEYEKAAPVGARFRIELPAGDRR